MAKTIGRRDALDKVSDLTHKIEMLIITSIRGDEQGISPEHYYAINEAVSNLRNKLHAETMQRSSRLEVK